MLSVWRALLAAESDTALAQEVIRYSSNWLQISPQPLADSTDNILSSERTTYFPAPLKLVHVAYSARYVTER